MKKAKVSKYMESLAKKYQLDVTSFIGEGEHNSTHKVYKFTNNFLANFEALAAEANNKGYVKSNEYGYGTLVKL